MIQANTDMKNRDEVAVPAPEGVGRKQRSIEIDEYSFETTAEAIWNNNQIARSRYGTLDDLREWMIAETKSVNERTSGWGTMGFYVSILRCGQARASVEGWFVLMMGQQSRTTRKV